MMRNLTRMVVESGQLEFTGGGWSMNDEAATHFSSIISNMETGLSWLVENMGQCAIPTIAWQIDPFGHSKEQAKLFAEMGFEGLFFARIDYRDKEERKRNQELQMIWEGGEQGDLTSSIFTGVFDEHYSAPKGFCWDILCTDEPINDDTRLEDYNLEETLDKFASTVHQHIQYFKNQNHIMFTMGDDFHFQNAKQYFKNMDKLIKHMNARTQETGLHLQYSTPSCYLKALREGSEQYPVKTDDFFPYASGQHSYWTGYFTSRPSIKLQERLGARDLSVCRQVDLLSRSEENKEKVFNMQRVMGLMQHHDAVTGTEKQHVAEDYATRLYKAAEECGDMVVDNLASIAGLPPSVVSLENTRCPLLNISQCHVSETSDQFVVLLYNPLSHPYSPYIRIPVPSPQYEVHDAQGDLVNVQVNPILDYISQLPARDSSAQFELIFQVDDLKPLGFTSVYVSKTSGENPDVGIETKLASNSGLNISGVEVDLLYYQGSSSSNQPSGAYIFRPSGSEKHQMGEYKSSCMNGDLVNETVVRAGDWGVLTAREYKGVPFTEITWQVGPIPVEDKVGKEPVMVYSTNSETDGIFYTDSNGRQMIKRVRNQRESYDLVDNSEPASSNYYPVTNRLELRGSKRVTVLTDRSQGGASLEDGQMELMVHRRLLHDDHFGVGEALNEMESGKGLVARGRHWLLQGEVTGSAREATQLLTLPPQLFFLDTELSLAEWLELGQRSYSGIKADIPKQVQVLTLAKGRGGTVLLRFHHIHDAEENEDIAEFNIQDMFTEFSVVSITEMNLGANQPIGDSSSALDITLQPQQIKTFLADVNWNT